MSHFPCGSVANFVLGIGEAVSLSEAELAEKQVKETATAN